jgi:hypothetical protein
MKLPAGLFLFGEQALNPDRLRLELRDTPWREG